MWTWVLIYFAIAAVLLIAFLAGELGLWEGGVVVSMFATAILWPLLILLLLWIGFAWLVEKFAEYVKRIGKLPE